MSFQGDLLLLSAWAYLSPPGCPTALLDLPDHCSHQKQREETAAGKEHTVRQRHTAMLGSHGETPSTPQLPSS